MEDPSKPKPLHEHVLGQLVSGHREMLHETRQVAEADVDDLDAFVPGKSDDFGSGPVLHGSSLVRPRARQMDTWSQRVVPLRFWIIAHLLTARELEARPGRPRMARQAPRLH